MDPRSIWHGCQNNVTGWFSPDGIYPQHLKDLINCQERGSDLLTTLTDLSAWFCPANVLGKSLHFSSAANLLPFGRRSQVAWPVAIHVGLTLFRLASKCKFVRCRSSAWGGLKIRDYNYRHRPKCRGWKTHDQPVTESQSSKTQSYIM